MKIGSVWQDGVTLPSFPTLQGDTSTEVLIIGGGIAGILTAYMLHQKKIPYLLVEKGRICGGNTQNTTAKLTYQHGLIYHKLIKSFGIEQAHEYLQANKEAFEKYVSLCKTIDCDFEERDNFVYSVNDRAILESELRALGKINYGATLCERLPLPFPTAGAVCFHAQGQFNPLKFLASISKDLNILENTHVLEFRGKEIVTNRGRIRANKVIVATHFPMLNKHGSYFLKLYQHRSYVLALENAWDMGGMYVDENMTGFSFRNYQNLLLLGGGSHRTGKSGGNWEELRQFAKRHYPHATEYGQWAAQDCMSLDGIPYIGQYSKSTPALYVASGFNKWGMTGAMLAATILCDKVSEVKNEYAHLFDPSRSIFKPQLLINSLESAKNLLSFSKKRCPHLGCALKWNKAEHSWDCPCHGSRFDEHGNLLDNPANGDLS